MKKRTLQSIAIVGAFATLIGNSSVMGVSSTEPKTVPAIEAKEKIKSKEPWWWYICCAGGGCGCMGKDRKP